MATPALIDLSSCTSGYGDTNEVSFLVSDCKVCGMPFFQGSLFCDTLAVISVFVAACLPLQVKIMRNGVCPDLRMSHTHTQHQDSFSSLDVMNFGHNICNKTPDVKLLMKSVLMSQIPQESVNYNEISYNNKIISYFSLSAPCSQGKREPAGYSSQFFFKC